MTKLYGDEHRERIVHTLHDVVIQRVFAAGLALQSVLPRVEDAEVRRRVQGVVRQLDDTVRDIRTTLLDLQKAGLDEHAGSLRRRVADIVTDSAGDDLESTVRMSGAVDSLVTGELAADVEAVVREGVGNVARHAGARHVTATLEVADEVTVEIVDDGRGTDPQAAWTGLRALEQLARRRGGGLSLEELPDGGTRLHWSAPLR